MLKNEEKVKVFSNIAKINRAMQRELNKRLDKIGLTYLDFLVLRALTEGQSTMVSLSRRFYVTQSAMTIAIDRLERNGLVKRERDKQDRRVIYVKITDEGIKIFQKAIEVYLQLAEEILNGIDTELIMETINNLEKILEKINSLKD
ncbi:MarR family winged helix-turn-helix transcriptional regulator [Acidianus manzaensis]|uniref:HTH-type transcriptional regulator SarZ n=1 Tax=Acidianus manzaensis TaxID=282676 RepID=A0A1W6JWZ1_9CREN|nr:MarR family transcriptional regulator [Acidianus manzaensis]ARM74767.1 MarR family transcriptional regulator [Acidianus manzaensis]